MRGKKSLIIAGCVMVLAAGTMTAVYMVQDADQDNKIVAERDLESSEADTGEQNQDRQQAVDVNSIIRPQQKDDQAQQKADVPASDSEGGHMDEALAASQEPQQEPEQQEPETKPASAQVQQEETMHFAEDSTLNWPLQGTVIMNYSMDQTVHFATLDQYKYNPAIIIAGDVNDRVNCAAKGKITDISTNEITGKTVTMDLGDGYTAIYGQLKEIPHEVGDVVDAGSLVGYIAEQTKYYSLEGSNLYFALEKDGEPVDPSGYFQ